MGVRFSVRSVSCKACTEDWMGCCQQTLCRVMNKNSVHLGARKGINLPGAKLDLPALTERDKQVHSVEVLN